MQIQELQDLNPILIKWKYMLQILLWIVGAYMCIISLSSPVLGIYFIFMKNLWIQLNLKK